MPGAIRSVKSPVRREVIANEMSKVQSMDMGFNQRSRVQERKVIAFMPEVTFTDVTEPEDGENITVWSCDLCGQTFMTYPGTIHDPMRKHPDHCEGPPDVD